MISARVQSVKNWVPDYPVALFFLERGMGLICTKLAEQNRNLDTFYREPVPLCAILIHTAYIVATGKITKLDTFYREPVQKCPIFCEDCQSNENTPKPFYPTAQEIRRVLS